MRTLFVYPEFPKTFWSYEKILELVNRKVLLPPLGMVTVAALLPQHWPMKPSATPPWSPFSSPLPASRCLAWGAPSGA